MTDIVYQSNYHFVVGHGPHKCGAVGCVLCSCVMILHEFGDTETTPEIFNDHAIEDGAFDDAGTEGDEIDVAKAMARYGVTVDDRKFEGMQYELAQIFGMHGRALIRVAFTDASHGDHTITGVGADSKTGEILCLDPAIGHVRLSPQLTAQKLGWGKDDAGNPITKNYRVTNVRGLHKG